MRTRLILMVLGLVAAIATALLVGLVARGSDEDSARRRVVAAFYPLAFAAAEIGENLVEVESLTPPGAEPHDLEVSADDVRDLRSADLVLLLGHGFQPQLERAAGTNGRVLTLLDTPGLERLANGDPHVWLDPLRYAKLVVRIGEALGEPAAAKKLVGRLRQLDRDYRRGLRDCERHAIVTSHDAFAYLAQRYGLRPIAITGLAPEMEPTPGDLRRVVRAVRETGATTVYFETLVSPRLAETVARETGTSVASLNPIEGLTREEAKRGTDYFTLMRANLANLRRGLGCR